MRTMNEKRVEDLLDACLADMDNMYGCGWTKGFLIDFGLTDEELKELGYDEVEVEGWDNDEA